jgi:hypothetical protein
MRNLTDFRRHAQYCSCQLVNPAKFLPSGMLAISRGFCELTRARGSLLGTLLPLIDGFCTTAFPIAAI